ncbi:MAG TPA: hypothetical protein DCE41_04440 [Cytophagales bacterium]|nr:hypothetical protein [Cytophagales bacterium]HAA18316.1 hypothetical protein [Cytophagales bacterium]HAP64846.1 hypothetical protein [Cytophagales bacterium]
MRIFLFLLACGFVHSVQAQNDSLVARTTYQTDDYTIEYPANWALDTTGTMRSAFIVLNPISNWSDDFRENVNLLIQDLSGQGVTLDSFVEITESQVQRMVPEGKLIASDRIEGELPYHQMTYSGILSGQYLAIRQYFWVIEEQAYVLTFTCKLADQEKYAELGERILSSFRFL